MKELIKVALFAQAGMTEDRTWLDLNLGADISERQGARSRAQAFSEVLCHTLIQLGFTPEEANLECL